MSLLKQNRLFVLLLIVYLWFYIISLFLKTITVDFSKLFDKEALVQRIKAQGKALTKLVVSELINEFLKLLNIHKVGNSIRI